MSLEVRPGEVHCLLGENGAGKSTLIAMLAGLQQPDSGEIEMAGEQLVFAAPADSLAQGIGVVFQHSALIATMTVAENLMLGGHGGFWLNREDTLDHLASVGELFGVQLDPLARVGELSLGEQQQLEIAKVLLGEPRVLVLDEPTSMLSADAIARLGRSIRQLSDRGVAVILVTHKLEEALQLSDRMTVLRNGQVAARFESEELRASSAGSARILAAMFGSEDVAAGAASDAVAVGAVAAVSDATVSVAAAASVAVEPGDSAVRLRRNSVGPELLHLEAVSVPAQPVGLNQLSLRLRAGEVLGIAGIDGQGQRALAEIIAGQLRPHSGRVWFAGVDVSAHTVRSRQRLGIRYVTDDRLHEGIVASFSVMLNLLLTRVGERPFWRRGRLQREAAEQHSAQLIERFGISPADGQLRAGTLSGGNIQKILLARAIDGDAKLVVFHKPSYGLDLQTVRMVHEEIAALAESGVAVLLISTDLDELLDLSDRIAVISNGRIVGEVADTHADPDTHEVAAERTRDALRAHIGELMAGGDPR